MEYKENYEWSTSCFAANCHDDTLYVPVLRDAVNGVPHRVPPQEPHRDRHMASGHKRAKVRVSLSRTVPSLREKEEDREKKLHSTNEPWIIPTDSELSK